MSRGKALKPEPLPKFTLKLHNLKNITGNTQHISQNNFKIISQFQTDFDLVSEGQAFLIQKLQKLSSKLLRLEQEQTNFINKIEDLRLIYETAKGELGSKKEVSRFLTEVDKFNRIINLRSSQKSKPGRHFLSADSLKNLANATFATGFKNNPSFTDVVTDELKLAIAKLQNISYTDFVSVQNGNSTDNSTNPFLDQLLGPYSLADSNIANLMITFANKIDMTEDKLTSLLFMTEKHQKELNRIKQKRLAENLERQKMAGKISDQENKLSHLINVVQGIMFVEGIVKSRIVWDKSTQVKQTI